jgi:hypothetical protein
MQNNTKETIQQVAEFIGCVDGEKVEQAIQNVDPNRRRSIDVEEPDENKLEWELVRSVYEALQEGEYALVQVQMDDYREFQRNNPNNAKWLDEDTFFPMNVSLHRDMLAKPELKHKMEQSKIRRAQGGVLCKSCPLYNRNGEVYTVVLPSDLEDITRNKIDCPELEKQVTLEECQQHWQTIQYDAAKLKCVGQVRNFKYGSNKPN